MRDYAKVGFVYLMTNPSMPGLFKVGCTERAPSARARELSRPTGVPEHFELLCYAEFESFELRERDLHRFLDAHRASSNREFFQTAALRRAVPWLYHHPQRLTFCDAVPRPNPPMLLDPDLLGLEGWPSLWHMPNLWEGDQL